MRLYADREAVLEPIEMWGRDVQRSVVIYDLELRPLRKARRVEVTGVVGNCEVENDAAVQAAQKEGLISLGASGYCHTSLETYIRPTSVRLTSRAPILRLTEAETPAERRGLVEAPPTSANLAEQAATARALIEAIASGDDAGFRRLVNPGFQERVRDLAERQSAWAEEADREVRVRFRQATRSFGAGARLHVAGERQSRSFVDWYSLSGAEALTGPTFDGFVTCFCKTEDCTGRWPVTQLDAGNSPDRPYLCVRTSTYVLSDDGEAVMAELTPAGEGFTEPPWPSRSARN